MVSLSLSNADLVRLRTASRGPADIKSVLGLVGLLVMVPASLEGSLWVGAFFLVISLLLIGSWLYGLFADPRDTPVAQALISGDVVRVRVAPVGTGTESKQVYVSLVMGTVIVLTVNRKADLRPLLDILRRNAPDAVFE